MAGAGLLNIGASNKDDAFYRYKMPRLITKIEGRGNGIKTNIVNMVDVAKALARPPAYTTKFFGCELGAQSKFDDKSGTSIVNGAHDNSKLVALLENFIKRYVQCYGCSNPETEILITKFGTITLKCAACGFISDVDMRDKLTTFIVKNPPEQKKSGKDKKLRRAEKERLAEGEAADEENKKSKKEGRKKKGQDEEKKSSKKKSTDEDSEPSPPGSVADDDDVENGDDDVQWAADTSEEAAQKRIQEQLTSITSEMVMPVESPRPKSKPPKKSMSSKKSEIKEADLPKIDELSLHDKLVKAFKAELASGSNATKLASLVRSKAEEENPQEVMNAYFQALFDGAGKDLHKEAGKKLAFLKQVAQDVESQKQLLVAIEMFCSAGVEVSKQVGLLLKVLYDEDVLEEEYITAWFKSKPSASPKAENVRKYAKVFVEWLETAEAESEEDEE